MKRLIFGFFIFLFTTALYAVPIPIENFNSYSHYTDFVPNAGYDDAPGGGSYDVKAITNAGYISNCVYYQYDLPNAWNNVGFTYWDTNNWTPFKRISFWIKASTNVEKVSFLFKECDDKDEWLYEYTGLSTNWQKVIMPLNQASWTYVDWNGDGGANNMTHTRISNWKMYFETATGGVSNAQVWIDEINGETNTIFDDFSFDSYNDYYDFIAAGYDDSPDPSGSYSLKEITTNGAHNGQCLHYIYSIGNQWETVGIVDNNATNFSYGNWFSFWVKGSNNNVTLDIILKEADNDEWLYTFTGITTNWQQVTIPFSASSWQSIDWDGDGGPGTFSVSNIVKWKIRAEAGGTINNNELYIDDISILTNPLPFDDWTFDSYVNYSGFLSAGYDDTPSDWNPADGDTYYNLKEITTNGAHSGQCLHYNYNIGDAWESIGFMNNNSTNWSAANWVSVWVKGDGVNTTLDIYFKESDGDEWIYQFNGITTNWQQVTAPLQASSWTYADWDGDGGPTNFGHTNIVKWGVFVESGTGGIANANVYIDDISILTNPLPFDDWTFDSYVNYSGFLSAGYDDTPSDWNPADGDTYYNLKEITTNGAHSGQCLHYNYNIGDAWESIGFMNNNSTNWSGASSFDVWVKGYAGDNETLDIYFKEADNDEWIYQFSGLNASWQKVSVPLVAGSWTATDWDGDGGPGTFSVANITKWGIFLESSTGGITGKDVWIDDISATIINNPPQIVDFSPKYNSATNNPVIELDVVDAQGVDTNSVVLKVNGLTVAPTIITGNTNVITYNSSGLPSNQRTKVELTIADTTAKTQYFSYSFWVGNHQEYTYDNFEYDKNHLQAFWGTPFYNATGTADITTNSPYEGKSSVKLHYGTDPGYGEYGILKTFDTIQDWSGFSNLIIYTKASNVQPNTFLDILIYEDSGDVWTTQISTAFDQTSWEQQRVDISDNFAHLTFANWCTQQPGYTGDKLPNSDRVAKIQFNVSGQGLTNTVYLDDFYIHGWALPSDNIPPNFLTNNFSPKNGETNVAVNSNIYFEIDDNVKVISNSITAKVYYITYVSNNNYSTNSYTALSNGSFLAGYSGSIITNGNGYAVTINPNSNLPAGTTIEVRLTASDTSGNWSTNTYSFITRGVAFGITHPVDNQINVSKSQDITIFMDRVNDATINVMINSSTNWSVTNYATLNGSFVAPYSDGGSGIFGPNYPWKWVINCPNWGFSSTNKITVWAADYSGNWTTNVFSFVIEPDNEPPVAPVLVSPASNSITKDTTPQFAWNKVQDYSGIKYYEIEINSVVTQVTATNYTPSSDLNEGANFWRVRAVDNKNNIGSWSPMWKINVDTTPPDVISLKTPVSNSKVSSLSVNFQWHTGNDNISGISNYIIEIADNSSFAGAISIETNSTNVTQTISTGWNYWRVRAYDKMMNTNQWSSIWSVYVDTNEKIATLNFPANGAVITNRTPNYDWTPGGGPYWIEVRSNNINGPVVYSNTSIFGPPWSTNALLSDGIYVWRLRRTNSNDGGYYSWSGANQFIVDTTPPARPILVSPTNNTLTKNSALTFVWNEPSDLGGIAYYQLVIDASMNTVFATNYSTVLSEGKHTWTVKAFDKVGHQSEWSKTNTIIVDTTGPTSPQQIAPVNNTSIVATNSSSVKFVWNKSSDTNGVAYYEVELDFIVVAQTTNTNVIISGITAGYHYWRVRAIDKLGNIGSWSTNFWLFYFSSTNVDTTPPVTSVTPKGGTYLGSITVTLTANEDAKIYYTLDGSDPTTNSSYFVNSGTIKISTDTVLKYFAKDTVGNTETVKTEEYTIYSTKNSALIVPNVIDISSGQRGKIIIGFSGKAKIKVFNVMGDLVKEYPEKNYHRGDIEYFPENLMSDLGAGLYIVYIKGNNIDLKLKLILVK